MLVSIPHQTLNRIPEIKCNEAYRALKAYIAQREGELTLNINDVIIDAKDLSNNWCLGKNDSIPPPNIGIFPTECILSHTTNTASQFKDINSAAEDRKFTQLNPDDRLKGKAYPVYSIVELNPFAYIDHPTTSKPSCCTVPNSPEKFHICQEPGSLRGCRKEQDFDKQFDSKLPGSNDHLSLTKPRLVVKPRRDQPFETVNMEDPQELRVFVNKGDHSAKDSKVSESSINQLSLVASDLSHTGNKSKPKQTTGNDSLNRSAGISDQSNLDFCTFRQRPHDVSSNTTERKEIIPAQTHPHCSYSESLSHTTTTCVPVIASQSFPSHSSCCSTFPGVHHSAVSADRVWLSGTSRPVSYKELSNMSGASEDRCSCSRLIPKRCDSSPPNLAYSCAPGSQSAPLKYRATMMRRRVGDSGGSVRGGSGHQSAAEQGLGLLCRFVIAISSSVLIGLLLVLWMVFHFSFNFTVAVLTGAAVMILLSLAMFASKLIRCTLASLIPNLATSRGQVAGVIFLFGYLLTGPVSNVCSNLEEVSRSMSCSCESSYNQTMTLLRPYDEMMTHMNTTVLSLQSAAYNVSERLLPLTQGLGVIEMDIYLKRTHLMGTKRTCQQLIERAHSTCRSGMRRAHSQCLEVMGALGDVYHHARDVLDQMHPDRWTPRVPPVRQTRQVHLLPRRPGGAESTLAEDNRHICEPLNASQVCSTLENTEYRCQTSQWAGEGIQEAINLTRAALKSLSAALHFYISTEPYSRSRVNASHVIQNIRRHVIEEVKVVTETFRLVVDILVKLTFISLLLLINVSYLYIRCYLTKDAYDNIYVGREVITMDRKRKEMKEETILPLTRYEKRFLADCSVAKLSHSESGLYHGGLCIVALLFLMALTCYMFDFTLYWMLLVVERDGSTMSSLELLPKSALKLNITGDGIMVDLLQVFIRGLQRSQGLDSTFLPSIFTCAPSPFIPSLINLFVFSLFYVCFVLLVLQKAFMFRFRNKIASYFYPHRERTRAIQLYQFILGHRQRQQQSLGRAVRSNLQTLDLQEFISLRYQISAVFSRRGNERVSRRVRVCLVCLKAADSSHIACEDRDCRGVYCVDCYRDLNRRCPLCLYVSTEYDIEEELDDNGLENYALTAKSYL